MHQHIFQYEYRQGRLDYTKESLKKANVMCHLVVLFVPKRINHGYGVQHCNTSHKKVQHCIELID